MLVLGRIGRSWQLIWRQSGALARGLRVKFDIGNSALKISYGRRMEDIDGLCRWKKSIKQLSAWQARLGSPPLAGFMVSGVCRNDWLARIVGMARSKQR